MDYENDEDFQASEKDLKLTRDVKGIYDDMMYEVLPVMETVILPVCVSERV